MKEKSYKIIALEAENVKKLVAIEIKPDGNIVEITGKNGQGKTSVLDCIWWALAGASHIQATPIRKGTKKAKIKLDLGELIVTRTFKEGKHGGAVSQIAVESKDGSKFASPQKMLDELLGALTFDPLSFARMSPREQFDTLKKFAPGVNFDHIAEVQKGEFDRRAEMNRHAKDLRSQAAGINVPDDVPKKLVDESKLSDGIEAAVTSNGTIEGRKARREAAEDKIEELKAEAASLIKVAKTEEASKIKEAKILQKKLNDAPDLPKVIDVSEMKAKLEEVHIGNEAFRQRAGQDKLNEEAEALEEKAQELTESMDQREEEKKAAIAAAKLPVEGISFGVGEVLMNDLPFDQASDAEQLRASIAIAMSLNPKLRVIRVKNGSLLDEDSMKLLAEMAEEKDFQIWIERVDSSGKVGFVLEDGNVRKAEAVAA